MMKDVETEKRIEAFIKKHGMIEKGDVVVTGVSGGADSVCLLFVLCALRKKLGFQVLVCHVNHGLRGAAADRDEEYVRKLCGKLKVPCRIFHKNVELIARKWKQSPEEAGRTARREAFETVCKENGGTKIATAHHRNDNAETVLLNLARGTGLKGLCGIRPVRGKWIRPLLPLSRQQIEEYLDRKKISWQEDATNGEDDYTRNRIRHNVIPVLEEQINSRSVQHIDELSRQAQEIWEYLEYGTEQAWGRCVTAESDPEKSTGVKGPRALEIADFPFRQERPAVQKQLLRKCLTFVKGGEKDITAVHIADLMLLFDRQTGRKLDLPGEIRAERTGNGVWLGKRIPETDSRPPEENILNIPGMTQIPGTDLKIVCGFVQQADISRAREMPQKSYTKWIDYDIIKYTLSVRTRQSGDYFIIDTEGKRQKLKSYFINEKIPRGERDKMLLIADGHHIIWIPGRRMSRAYQIGSGTKRVLEIKILDERKTEDKKNVRDNQGTDPGGES